MLTESGKTDGLIRSRLAAERSESIQAGRFSRMCGTGKPTAELASLSALETCQSHLARTWVGDKSLSAHWSLVMMRSNRQRCPDRLAFKKTCPFEFTRHGRPLVDTETRPYSLPSSVSQFEFKKGNSGFLASDWDSRRLRRIRIIPAIGTQAELGL